jgi:hypothetical protein
MKATLPVGKRKPLTGTTEAVRTVDPVEEMAAGYAVSELAVAAPWVVPVTVTVADPDEAVKLPVGR